MKFTQTTLQSMRFLNPVFRPNNYLQIGFIASALLCFNSVGWAAAPPRKLSPDSVSAASVKDAVQVIVQWKIQPGAMTEAKILNLGGSVIREFTIIKGGTYLVPGTSLSQLESDPAVSYVTLDRRIHHKLDYTAAAVNANAALGAGWNGSGIGVAIIDSGINNDVNLANIALALDFTKANGKAGADQFGHGQHVAGIVASTSASTMINSAKATFTRNFVGIAPGVSLINLRVLDANGNGSDSNVIAALEASVLLKKIFNIRVVNLSLGRPVWESYALDPLCQAAEAAWRAGLVVVVAAGNDGRDNSANTSGYGTITAPGNDPYIITVGAMKTESTYNRGDDLIASYSSKGPTQIDHIVKPDLVAPGNRVVSLLSPGSTLASQNPGNMVVNSYFENTNPGQSQKNSNNFFMLSGTSMAAPVVSGAAADLLQLNPSLTPDQIKCLLMQTAYKTFPSTSSVTDPTSGLTFTAYYDIFTVGAGYLDIGAAMAAAGQVTTGGTSLSPVANYNPATGFVTVAFDPSSVFTNNAVWGNSAVWGAQAVWGSSVLDSANNAVWGSQAVWGTTSVSTQNAVWGTTAIWGTTTSVSEASSINIAGEQ